MADVHHLLILPPWRGLTSNESADFLYPETNAPKAKQRASYWEQRPSPGVWCGMMICLKFSVVIRTNIFINKWARSRAFTPAVSVLQQITLFSTTGFSLLYVDEINHIWNVHTGVFMVFAEIKWFSTSVTRAAVFMSPFFNLWYFFLSLCCPYGSSSITDTVSIRQIFCWLLFQLCSITTCNSGLVSMQPRS